MNDRSRISLPNPLSSPTLPIATLLSLISPPPISLFVMTSVSLPSPGLMVFVLHHSWITPSSFVFSYTASLIALQLFISISSEIIGIALLVSSPRNWHVYCFPQFSGASLCIATNSHQRDLEFYAHIACLHSHSSTSLPLEIFSKSHCCELITCTDLSVIRVKLTVWIYSTKKSTGNTI